MNILNYIKSLLPSFGRDRIFDDLSRMRADLDDSLLPSLTAAAAAFRTQKLASPVAIGIERALQAKFRSHNHLKLFDLLVLVFKAAPAKLDVLDKAVEEYFAKDVVAEGLTYRHSTILQYAETMTFAMRYTAQQVRRVLAAEAAVASGKPDPDESYLTAREKAEYNARYSNWLDALGVIERSATELKNAIANVPDVVVDETTAAAVAAHVGTKNLDPMGMNFITPSWNPIYKVRMVKAEWDVARINQSKEERKMVELRLRELKNQREGIDDAKIQHQIEVVEDRLKKLDFKITKLAGDLD